MKRSGFFIFTLLFCNFGFGCVRPMRFEGTSMRPNLENGDKIVFDTNYNELKRGEIIAFRFPKNEKATYIKRIIGLPGETLEIKDDIVFIDGKELKEDYLDPTLNAEHADYAKIQIDDVSYFVMGDNRFNSSDSRIWGTVKKDLVIGKYLYTYSHEPK